MVLHGVGRQELVGELLRRCHVGSLRLELVAVERQVVVVERLDGHVVVRQVLVGGRLELRKLVQPRSAGGPTVGRPMLA